MQKVKNIEKRINIDSKESGESSEERPAVSSSAQNRVYSKTVTANVQSQPQLFNDIFNVRQFFFFFNEYDLTNFFCL